MNTQQLKTEAAQYRQNAKDAREDNAPKSAARWSRMALEIEKRIARIEANRKAA